MGRRVGRRQMGDKGGKLGGLFWGFLTEIGWHRTDDIVGKHATRIATVWDPEQLRTPSLLIK